MAISILLICVYGLQALVAGITGWYRYIGCIFFITIICMCYVYVCTVTYFKADDSACSALGYNIVHTMLYVCDIAIATGKLRSEQVEALLSLRAELVSAYGCPLNTTDAHYFVFRDT